jgi:two-component system invasion response regulator UvrY
MTSILLVDDHAVVRQGLKQILGENFSDVKVMEASDGAEARVKLCEDSCDAVILDLSLPGLSGLDVLKRLRAEGSTLPVLVLSMHSEDEYGLRVLRAGAAGFLTKSCAPEKLVEAVQCLLAGRQYFSPKLVRRLAQQLQDSSADEPHQVLSDREDQVLHMIAAGKSISEIAKELCLSVKTISTYRSRILAKMHFKNNTELIHYAVTYGLVS